MPVTATPENCDKRGEELTLYYNTGDDTTEVWVEHVGIVGDMTLNETEDLQEQSARRSTRQVKEYTEGEIELSINGTQLTDTDYEGWILLNSMRREGAAQDIMVLTGPITDVGSQGWRGMMRNADRTINGPATGAMTTNFNLQPAACTDVPVRAVRIEEASVVSDFDATVFTPYGV